MKTHEISALFPIMTKEEYEGLKASIASDGLLEPITTHEGKILDGRNRARACKELGVELRTVEYDGSDPVRFVLARNLHRHHLNESQRALIAAKIASMKQGARTDLAPFGAKSQPEAAEVLNVSRRKVQRARKIVDSGTAALVRAVEQGQVAVNEAAAIAELDPKAQHEILSLESKRERKAKIAAEKTKQEFRRASMPDPGSFVLTGRSAKAIEDYYTIESGSKLPKKEQESILETGFQSKAKLNEQDTTSIEWAMFSLNTVTGCLHGCPYCYARDIAERFLPQGFEPTFYPARLAAPANTKVPEEAANDPSYKNIFANSMSDLFGQWVPADWIEATIEMARRNPQRNFLLLTKFPQRAAEFKFPKNWWMGTTVDAQARVGPAEKAFEKIRCGTKWVSCEPLLEPLCFTRLDLFQWVVIGGASASTKTPEWIPPFDWIADLHMQARAAGCRVYHKTNTGLPDWLKVREFPWAEPPVKHLPKPFQYLKGMK
ncbi:MAG: DUF5131 family protein [Acidobacteriota bacterium]